MAEKIKSKTNVAARSDTKNNSKICRFCGNKVEVVLAVYPTGKKKIRRICCEG